MLVYQQKEIGYIQELMKGMLQYSVIKVNYLVLIVFVIMQVNINMNKNINVLTMK